MRTKLAAVLTVLSLLITPLSPVITIASAAGEAMVISTDGLELIQELEGFSSEAYQSGGQWYITVPSKQKNTLTACSSVWGFRRRKRPPSLDSSIFGAVKPPLHQGFRLRRKRCAAKAARSRRAVEMSFYFSLCCLHGSLTMYETRQDLDFNLSRSCPFDSVFAISLIAYFFFPPSNLPMTQTRIAIMPSTTKMPIIP